MGRVAESCASGRRVGGSGLVILGCTLDPGSENQGYEASTVASELGSGGVGLGEPGFAFDPRFLEPRLRGRAFIFRRFPNVCLGHFAIGRATTATTAFVWIWFECSIEVEQSAEDDERYDGDFDSFHNYTIRQTAYLPDRR